MHRDHLTMFTTARMAISGTPMISTHLMKGVICSPPSLRSGRGRCPSFTVIPKCPLYTESSTEELFKLSIVSKIRVVGVAKFSKCPLAWSYMEVILLRR